MSSLKEDSNNIMQSKGVGLFEVTPFQDDEYGYGDQVYFKLKENGKSRIGIGKIVGQGSSVSGPLRSWIVELTAEDALEISREGMRCFLFISRHLKLLKKA